MTNLAAEQLLESLLAQGCQAAAVHARRGAAILYYSEAGQPDWAELHLRLDRPAAIIITVIPDPSNITETDHVPELPDHEPQSRLL